MLITQPRDWADDHLEDWRDAIAANQNSIAAQRLLHAREMREDAAARSRSTQFDPTEIEGLHEPILMHTWREKLALWFLSIGSILAFSAFGFAIGYHWAH
jgi:hypothetical protein